MRAYETMNQSSPFQDGSKRAILLAFSVFCSLLLVYASLVPLKYTPLSWSDSLQRWQDIPWLNLSVANRADWIAKCAGGDPLAFLLCGAVDYGKPTRRALMVYAPIIAGALCSLVVAIECVQIWFPPRTSRKTISLRLHRKRVLGARFGGLSDALFAIRLTYSSLYLRSEKRINGLPVLPV